MEKTNAVQIETASSAEPGGSGSSSGQVVGNVKLLDDNQVILIPTQSPDPKDPLNLPQWRKWAIIALVAAYGCAAVVLASGLGPIFSMVVASYPGQEAKANDLMTYPTLFMGIGNLIAMPLALTIGRRPVFLASIILLIVGGIWCTFSKSLDSQIAGRDIMSLAAGQSEALAPLMVGTGVFFIVSTYMTAAWGWRWWYGFFSIINGVILVLSYIFVSETLYNRPEDATTGAVHLVFNEKGDMEKGGEIHKLVRVTTAHGVVLEPDRFGPRTWKHDLKIFTVKPRWMKIVESFPLRAASLLVVLCAGRGFISFSLSYTTLPSISSIGYDGACIVEGIIAGGLALLAVPIYFFGVKIRAFGQNRLGMGASKEMEEQ